MNFIYEHKQAMTLIGFSTMIRPDYECGVWVPVERK